MEAVRYQPFVSLLSLLFVLATGFAYEFDCSRSDSISVCNDIQVPVMPYGGMTPEYLDAKCTHLKEGNECLLKHAKACMKPAERKYTEIILAGMVKLQENLCDSPTYREDYVKYYQCRADSVVQCKRHMQPALTVEKAPPGEYSQDQIITTTCKSYKDFMSCSEKDVDHMCRPAAADFVRTYLRMLHGPFLNAYCTPSTSTSRRRRFAGAIHSPGGAIDHLSRVALE